MQFKPYDSVEIINTKVCNKTIEELVDIADEAIRLRRLSFGTGINLNQLYLAKHNPDFARALNNATLLLPDGTPILWIAKWMGKPLKCKVRGGDYTIELCKLAIRKGYGVYILGGKPGSAERAIKILRAKYGDMKVAGYYCPPFGYDDNPEETEKIISQLKNSGADILLMALSAPRQEIFVEKYYKELKIPVIFGAGIAVDYFAGRIKQAPRSINRIGMEWLYRFAQEPRRLFKRYIIHDLPFLFYMWFWAKKQKKNSS